MRYIRSCTEVDQLKQILPKIRKTNCEGFYYCDSPSHLTLLFIQTSVVCYHYKECHQEIYSIRGDKTLEYIHIYIVSYTLLFIHNETNTHVFIVNNNTHFINISRYIHSSKALIT